MLITRATTVCATVLLVVISLVAITSACSTPDSVPSQPVDVTPQPFDAKAFEAIRPEPTLRGIDLSIDSGFDEREKLPRDAISPVYSPKYVTPEEAPTLNEELVMGIAINGEARAMPVGLMRFREMVNDVIGGVPILATW